MQEASDKRAAENRRRRWPLEDHSPVGERCSGEKVPSLGEGHPRVCKLGENREDGEEREAADHGSYRGGLEREEGEESVENVGREPGPDEGFEREARIAAQTR